MDVKLVPGTYVVAVSGGVDSMCLLHVLATEFDKKYYSFTVAHFEHGIRGDSDEDRKLVSRSAQLYGLPFVYKHGQLGPATSEEKARDRRYAFLRSVLRATDAQAILTAHHKDDALETAIFNLLRGTGRQGMGQLAGQSDIQRPLIAHTKKELYAYAKEHDVQWREDTTNTDLTYRRNYIRHQLIPRLTPEKKTALQHLIRGVDARNDEIDAIIKDLIKNNAQSAQLKRSLFTTLPHIVAKEVLVYWLRQNNIRSFDRRQIEQLTIAIKTGLSGSRYDIKQGYTLQLTPNVAYIFAVTEKKS